MQVSLNGETTELPDGMTIAGLLDRLGLGRDRVAVEVNLDIVPKGAHETHTLADGDRIEVVHFVGGG